MIFLGQSKTEIKLMIFLTSNIVELKFLGSLDAIQTYYICIVSGYFTFMYWL